MQLTTIGKFHLGSGYGQSGTSSTNVGMSESGKFVKKKREKVSEIAKVLEAQGFVTKREMKKLIGYNISVKETYKKLKKAFPQSMFFMKKFIGLYTEGYEMSLDLANKREPRKYMIPNPFNKFLSERILFYTRNRGLSHQEAFKQGVNDWNAQKQKHTQSAVQVVLKEQFEQRSKDTVYEKVLADFVVHHVKKDGVWLDALGTQLRLGKEISFVWRNMYVSEADWEIICPLLITHAMELERVWDLVGSLCIDNGVLKVTRVEVAQNG